MLIFFFLIILTKKYSFLIFQAFAGSSILLENWLNFSSEKNHKANTALESLQNKNKDKKKTVNSAPQTLILAQNELKNTLNYFGLCVSTVRYIVSTVGVLGGTGTQKFQQSMSTEGNFL